MTKRFYKLMCFATAAAMNLIGCNNVVEPLYGIVPTDYDTTDIDEYEDALLYGDPYTEYEADQPVVPDADTNDIGPDKSDADYADEYGPPETEFAPDTDIDEVQDVMYGPDAVDFDDSVDNDANVDEDADADEYEALLYADPYTEYDADLGNDNDEIIGTDDDK